MIGCASEPCVACGMFGKKTSVYGRKVCAVVNRGQQNNLVETEKGERLRVRFFCFWGGQARRKADFWS